MTQKNIAIDDASAAELRAFATTHLGLEISPNANRATMISKIKQAWAKPDILVEEGAEPLPVAAKPIKVSKEDNPEEGRVRLRISPSNDDDGDEPVPLGVNGKVMLVPRNIEVEIPRTYFNVLENAVQHKFDPLPDGGINPVPRKVPLYPYQVIQFIPAA